MLTELDGIGDSSAKVITEALRGETPAYLAKLEGESQVTITPGGEIHAQRTVQNAPIGELE